MVMSVIELNCENALIVNHSVGIYRMSIHNWDCRGNRRKQIAWKKPSINRGIQGKILDVINRFLGSDISIWSKSD